MEDLKYCKKKIEKGKRNRFKRTLHDRFVILNGFRIRSRLVLPAAVVRHNKANKNSLDVCKRVCLHCLYIIFRGE